MHDHPLTTPKAARPVPSCPVPSGPPFFFRSSRPSSSPGRTWCRHSSTASGCLSTGWGGWGSCKQGAGQGWAIATGAATYMSIPPSCFVHRLRVRCRRTHAIMPCHLVVPLPPPLPPAHPPAPSSPHPLAGRCRTSRWWCRRWTRYALPTCWRPAWMCSARCCSRVSWAAGRGGGGRLLSNGQAGVRQAQHLACIGACPPAPPPYGTNAGS